MKNKYIVFLHDGLFKEVEAEKFDAKLGNILFYVNEEPVAYFNQLSVRYVVKKENNQ